MLREWGMGLHVDCHGTSISEELANFILSVGHVVMLDHPEDKDGNPLECLYCVISQKTEIQNNVTETKANLGVVINGTNED